MLEASSLSFSYGRLSPVPVLRAFDWAVPAGKTTLLLGPNGAGKSTLMRLLSGFDRPDAGVVSINGETGRRALYRHVGWMPQDVQPGRRLTVAEQVEFVAWVGGQSRRTARERAREVIASVDLEDQRDVRTDRLSGGQLRRVGLAQALVRRAPVLLLDEPTAGLDPAQSLNLRALLRDVECPGGVVISTHQINDLAEDVDHVVVLAQGQIRFEGTMDQLVQRFGPAQSGPDAAAAAFTALVGGGRH